MRDTWLVLLVLILLVGGIAAGISFIRGFDEFGSPGHCIMGVACLLLLIMAAGTWSFVRQARAGDRYSHLSGKDRTQVEQREAPDEDWMTEEDRRRYSSDLAGFETAMANAPTEEAHRPIPQHVYDEFEHPKGYYEAMLPEVFPDDPRAITREWSEETIIIEDEHGRRVYQEHRPKPRWLQKWEENQEDTEAGRPPRHTPPF